MANQPRKIGERPHAGQRSRSARHHSRNTGCDRLAAPRPTGACSLAGVVRQSSWLRMFEAAGASLLSSKRANVTVLTMYTLGRFLQIVALIIPPLAIIAELNERNPSQMLKFLAVAIGIFVLGYLVQRYSGDRPA